VKDPKVKKEKKSRYKNGDNINPQLKAEVLYLTNGDIGKLP
jgi:hypothetical protein